jgi:hypothetical protein
MFDETKEENMRKCTGKRREKVNKEKEILNARPLIKKLSVSIYSNKLLCMKLRMK